MGIYFKMAWRNLWRNKRRTAITLGSIFFAVILATLMMSIKEGTYDNMIKTSAGDFNGYVQIHQEGYWEEKSLDYSFEWNDSIQTALNSIEAIKSALPRIESFALAATDSLTRPSLVYGIDPELENEHHQLGDRIIEGEFLSANENAIIIGKGLADYMKLGINDTIILLGQGYHGISAAGKYPVKGIVKFGSPELSKQVVFLPINQASYLFGTEGLINNLALKIDQPRGLKKIQKELTANLGENYEVMAWMDLFPELVNMIETDRVEGYVFMFILYMVISFGIFGTVLMMLAERSHEFGVLIAIGMKRLKLGFIVFLEIFIISISGAILGILGAMPICYYFIVFPIEYGEEVAQMAEEYGMEAVLKASMDPSIFLQQAVVIALIGIAIGIYPIFKIARTNALKEMNH